jgi:hypothetical protein
MNTATNKVTRASDTLAQWIDNEYYRDIAVDPPWFELSTDNQERWRRFVSDMQEYFSPANRW